MNYNLIFIDRTFTGQFWSLLVVNVKFRGAFTLSACVIVVSHTEELINLFIS